MSEQQVSIEQFLRDAFEENYMLLQMEGAGFLAPDVKEAAFEQALLYWHKLRHIAENVTDTEVKLTLPRQYTPTGREYTIEGVVDIVRQDGQTMMYDFKTHEATFVRNNVEQYQQQLNVYAHIWQALRGQALDGVAIIATTHPRRLKAALLSGDRARLAQELEQWEPVIDIPSDPNHVEETIRRFGETVDQIEDRAFAPPPVERLKSEAGYGRHRFANVVCRNCDARYSCNAYRTYSLESAGRIEERFRAYYGSGMTDEEREEWLNAALEAAPRADDLDALP